MGIFNPNIPGNAATADLLRTPRPIGGVSFNGGANINLPGVNAAGNQSTSGNAATASQVYQNSAGPGGISYRFLLGLSNNENGVVYNGAGIEYNLATNKATINISGNADTATTATNQSGGTVNATTATGQRFNNDGFVGANQGNAKNHFTQSNAATDGIVNGWIAAAFGKAAGARVIAAQALGNAHLGAHNGDLNAWASLFLQSGSTARLVIGDTDNGVDKVQIQGGLSVSGDVSVKDITASRGDGTGIIYLNAAKTRYLYWNGTNYIMEGGNLSVNGFNVVRSNGGTYNINISGNAATASNAIGVGQSWQDVTGSRATATNYTNSTGRSIVVQVSETTTASSTLTVGGVVVAANSGTNHDATLSAIVPNGVVYRFDGGGFTNWAELR